MAKFFIIDGRRFSESEIKLAERLIFRGKTFATRGDPRMTKLVRLLQRGGQRSIAEITAQRKQQQISEIKEIRSAGGEPIIRRGRLVGAEIGQQSVGIKQLRKGFTFKSPATRIRERLQLGTPLTTTQVLQQRREEVSRAPVKVIQKPISEVQPITRTGQEKLQRELGKLTTKRLRGQSLSAREKIKEAELASKLFVVETAIAFGNLPRAIQELIRDPSKLKNLPTAIIRSGKETFELVETSPTQGIVRIGGELIVLKGSGKVFNALSKASAYTTANLSTKFKGVARVGKTLTITTRAGKKIDLKVVGRIGSKTLKTETFRSQVDIAGRKAIPVSAQANALVGFIRRSRLIRKPILKEERLSKSTKRLLRKFDERTISSRELIQLDNQIREQIGGGILERSFFADPKGRIRPSRIKPEDEATLLDILSGEVSLRGTKPQVLVFDKVRVEKLPKALNNIERKLRANKPLTEAEGSALLKFQLKKSGKFKPIGFLTKEAEISLAPGEIIQKVKKVGVTLINGKKVPIIEARVIKPTGALKKNIELAKKGKLNKKQLKTLDRKLRRKTGFDYDVSSRGLSGKRIDLKKFGSNILSKVSRARRRARPSRPSRPTRKKRVSKVARPSKVSRPSRAGRRARPSKVARPSRPFRPRRARAGIIAPIPRIKRRKKAKKIKKRFGYDAFARKRTLKGKRLRKAIFIKLNTKPLTKKQAKNRGAFVIDNTTGRTFKVKRVGKFKKLGKLTKREAKYFQNTKKKYRPFKIRKGIKRPISRKWIERKGKFLIDTRGEKRGLRIGKLVKQLNRPAPRPSSSGRPKPSTLQLENLRKGREKLARMRKNK